MKDIKLSLQVGAVFIGTVVGAGFASGQEIMQFFTCFGQAGMITLLLSGVLFYIIADAVMKASAYYNTYSYKELIHRIAGNRTGFIFDIIMTAFLLIGTSVMFAGSGALFHESLSLPRTWGIALMALLTLFIILQALTGILRINSIIVPMLFTVIVAVLAATIANSDMGNIVAKLTENYRGSFIKPLLFFLFYCCYNTFLSLGVLAAIPERIKSRSVLKVGVFLGGMGLMFLSLMLNISLTLKSPQVFEYSIPMSYITSGFGTVIKNSVAICIWCEIFSTAVSNTFSIARRISGSRGISYRQACFLTVLCCLPLSFMEFKGLIRFFYPLFGAFSMFIILRLLYCSHRLGKKVKGLGYLSLVLCLVIASVYIVSSSQQSFAPVSPAASSYDTAMKQDILCLMMAYPEHISNVEQSEGRIYIVMKSGRKILYDDKKIKSIEGKIANPDLQDMMEQAYPIAPIEKLMDKNNDPGRARVYSLLKDVYGESRQQIEANLVNVRAGYGAFQFNKNNRAAEALKSVMSELVQLAEKRQDIRASAYPCSGTYNYRTIAGTNRLSPHSFGIAIDLARDKRDYWQWATREEGQKRLTSYPVELVEIFEKNNFIWGGKWGHFDILHFEYRPEIIIKACYFGSTGNNKRIWYNGVPQEDEFIKSCIEKIDNAIE